MSTCLIAASLACCVAAPQDTQEQRITVGQIVIVGNTKTSDGVIRKAVKIAPGERITYTMVRQAQKRLVGLEIFEDATINVVPAADGETTNDILIQVSERTPQPKQGLPAKLRGQWRTTLTNAEVTLSRWRFGDDTVSIFSGSDAGSISIELHSTCHVAVKGPKQVLVFQVLGQKVTAQYAFVDNDTLFVRLPRLGQDDPGFDTYVLERVPENRPQDK
jgi:hypothetical protein